MAADYPPPACESFRPPSLVPRPLCYKLPVKNSDNFIKITTAQNCKAVTVLLNLTNYIKANGSLPHN